MKSTLRIKIAALALALAGAFGAAQEAAAQSNEIFVPVLVYRTGAYAPNGIPWADGFVDSLKGKKIALVYHDSPYGKEPIPLLEARAKMEGFELLKLPVTHPGVEQKATWLQIRQQRPDYVFLWGWGVMNSTAIKEAIAVGYPREKMYGVWWSGAEQDVRPAEAGATGYNSATLQHTSGRFKLHEDLKKYVYDKGHGSARWEDTGEILYIRGLINAMLGVEAIRTAQEKFGKKPMTGEQVRW